MKRDPHSRTKRITTKSVLRLPELEYAKAAVLNSLTSRDAQRGYSHAIDEFVEWYCSELCLAFNRLVVLRYRSHLEFRQLAPGTINLRFGAVRRLAYEAADCGRMVGAKSTYRGLALYSPIWDREEATNGAYKRMPTRYGQEANLPVVQARTRRCATYSYPRSREVAGPEF